MSVNIFFFKGHFMFHWTDRCRLPISHFLSLNAALMLILDYIIPLVTFREVTKGSSRGEMLIVLPHSRQRPFPLACLSMSNGMILRKCEIC